MDFDKSIIENLIAITPQRELADVAKECDIAFVRYHQDVTLPQKKSTKPFRAAIDFATDNKKTCLVIMHGWFCVVPPRETNLAGWGRALRLWETTKNASNNFEGI